MPVQKKRKLSPSRKGLPCGQGSLLRQGSPSAGFSREDDASYSMIGRQTGRSRQVVANDIHTVSSQPTPYGPIFKSFDIATDEGQVKIEYACPFAFLYHACANTPLYSFLKRALCLALEGRIVIYWDETRPGNLLRPDIARSMTGIFWGIADLPDWWRCKAAFWFVFAHVPTKIMQKVKGGASAVFLKMLQIFWASDDHNMERLGVRCRGSEVLKFKYGFIIVDEKAEKELLGLKGAGGMRMCASCLNCVKTEKRLPAGSNLVIFSNPDMNKFEQNTPSLLSAALDHLAAQKDVLNKTRFKALEMALGITYEHCVVLYSGYRKMLDYPKSRYTDWFHDLLASGGVFQIVVNEVVLDICEMTGVTLTDIDLFQSSITFPCARLNKKFFQDRIVGKRGKHVRAFASETITAVQALCLMFCCVFSGAQEFTRQKRLCNLARESLEILLSGDVAVRLADRLDAALQQLQTILLDLYPWSATPKLHLMRHIKDGLKTHQVNLSCGGGERKHRRTKQLGRFAYNHFQATILRRTIKRCLDDLGNHGSYSDTELSGHGKWMTVLGTPMQVWPRASIGLRQLVTGNIVYWRCGDCRLFGLLRGISRFNGRLGVVVFALQPSASGQFKCLGEELIVDCSALNGVAVFIKVGVDMFDILQPIL